MELERFLTEHRIAYVRYEHPPVFTCEEANRLCPEMPAAAAKTKNLFLRDKKGRRHFLVTVPDEKTVDVKALGAVLGVGNLSFASPERLQTYLGLDPGAVTLLGVINDLHRAVEVIIDTAVWNAPAVRCHPLVNTRTLVISQTDLRRFFELTGHAARVLDIPGKE